MTVVNVAREMKPNPFVIPSDAILDVAVQLMLKYGIRHLPVLKDGRLVGVLNDRALKQALMLGERNSLTAADVMIPDPMTVEADEIVSDVAQKMADTKDDCAIVVDGKGSVIGIFTSTDSMRLLHRVLDQSDSEESRAEELTDCLWRVPG